MLFTKFSAFTLAFIGASAAAVSKSAPAGDELSCVSKCWTNSQYVSSCAGNSKCLCDDAEFQNALYQCLYSQCQTAQFGDALHQSLGLCKAAAADDSIPYVAPVRVNDLRKRQNKGMSGSVTRSSHSRTSTKSSLIGPISGSATTSSKPHHTSSSSKSAVAPISTDTTCTDSSVVAAPTGAPAYPSAYQPGNPSAVAPTGAPAYPSAYQPGNPSAVAPIGAPASPSAYQPGAYPSAYQPGAPLSADPVGTAAPASGYPYGYPSAYQPSAVAPISGMPTAAAPSNTMSISAPAVHSSVRASPTAYYGATVTVTVDPSVVIVTVTVTSTSMPASTVTVEPVPAASPSAYSS